MRKRDRVLAAFRRMLLGDVYFRLQQLESRVGSLDSEIPLDGRYRHNRSLARRVEDLESEAAQRRPVGQVGPLGSDYLLTERVPIAPKLFAPARMIVPIDAAIELTQGKARQWLIERQAQGDPGPVYVEDGVLSTDQTDAEERAAGSNDEEGS